LSRPPRTGPHCTRSKRTQQGGLGWAGTRWRKSQQELARGPGVAQLCPRSRHQSTRKEQATRVPWRATRARATRPTRLRNLRTARATRRKATGLLSRTVRCFPPARPWRGPQQAPTTTARRRHLPELTEPPLPHRAMTIANSLPPRCPYLPRIKGTNTTMSRRGEASVRRRTKWEDRLAPVTTSRMAAAGGDCLSSTTIHVD